MRHKWTEEETQILIRMYPRHTAWEIAYRLGLTIPKVRAKFENLASKYLPGFSSAKAINVSKFQMIGAIHND